MNTYFALTIGPIYKTLALAKRTRELWAASYIFSYMMEVFVKQIEAMKFGVILLPVPRNKKKNEENTKAGLFPDRIIIQFNKDKKDEIFRKSKTFLENFFIDNFSELIDKRYQEPILKFFKNYFQFYYLELSLPEQEDPVSVILPILDSMEQKAVYVQEYQDYEYFFKYFFDNISEWEPYKFYLSRKPHMPLIFAIAATGLKGNEIKIPKEYQDLKPGRNFFDEVMELSRDETHDKEILKYLRIAYNNYPDENEDKPDWKRNPDEELFRQSHKYYAVVQADGDNLSQALHALYSTGKIDAVRDFSELLMEFGYRAMTIIEDFGGLPIYMGGDDLLFFAPVKYGGRTIFHLIRELETLFKDLFGTGQPKDLPHTADDQPNDEELKKNRERIEEKSKSVRSYISDWNASNTRENKRKPIDLSVSFGLFISYHKYPLKESLETVRKLLFEDAKLLPGKNALAFRILKHSGHCYGSLTGKNWRSYQVLFFEMLKEFGNIENSDEKIKFLSSVHYKLDPLRPLLVRILSGRKIDPEKAGFIENIGRFLPDESGRELMIKNLMDNFFNESIHNKDEAVRNFIMLSFRYLLQVYRDLEDVYGNNAGTAGKAIDNLYSVLRFIQFINQPDQDEED